MAESRSLSDWLLWQQRVHLRSIDLGLQRVAEVARRLGVDRPACPVITVAGTNGKGSTVAHLGAFSRAAGWRDGTFMSPHLLHYNERISIAGVPVTDAALVEAFDRIEQVRGEITLTYFEFNALAALDLFSRAKVDVMLLEVGLGGRLDATNLIDADVAVVCSIGFDHRDWLGDTLEQIGREKAGIFRAGRPAVLGVDMPASVHAVAAELRCDRWQLGENHAAVVDAHGHAWNYRGRAWRFDGLPPSALKGEIQFSNAANALAALEALGPRAPRLDRLQVAGALRRVRLRGRFEILHLQPEWILDVAHNEPAARLLAHALAARPCAGKTFAVAGILGDKDIEAIGSALAAAMNGWWLCSTDQEPRGTAATVLRERMPASCAALGLCPSVVAGCEAARRYAGRDDRVVVLGSFHTVGPALDWLRLY